MTTRTVAHTEAATTAMVGSNTVQRALPVRGLKQVDPFLFIDYMLPHEIRAGQKTRRIDPHPHAGFEVVTYMLEGKGFHRDSRGNEQVAGPGDINWMTSGKGIVHSEGAAAELTETGGTMSLMQVWINLPASKKFMAPSFRHYASASLPEIQEGNSSVKVLIGSYKGQQSPVSTHTPMYYYHIRAKAGEVLSYEVANDHTAGLYVMNGALKVLDHEAPAGTIVVFHNDGDQIAVKAQSDTSFIAFGGQPINEPVVSYGPFVMNDFKEIQQAIHDYETGRMGSLSF